MLCLSICLWGKIDTTAAAVVVVTCTPFGVLCLIAIINKIASSMFEVIIFLFFFSLLLSSFWTSYSLRCRDFSPLVRVFSFYRAYLVGFSIPTAGRLSSNVANSRFFSRFPRVKFHTRKSPYEFIQVCTRGDSNARNRPIAGTRITCYTTEAAGQTLLARTDDIFVVIFDGEQTRGGSLSK